MRNFLAVYTKEMRSYFAVPPALGTLWLFPGSMPHTDFSGSRCQGNNGPRLGTRCHTRGTDAVRNTTGEIQRPTTVVGSGHLQLQPGEVAYEPGMLRLDTERSGRILRMDANFSNGYHD